MTPAPRPCREAEIAAVAELWSQCGLTRPWNNPFDDIALCLRSPASALLVIDEPASGAILGSVMVGGDGHRGWLYYLAVDPGHRRRGLGRALVAAAEAWLARQGLAKAMLMVRTDNHAVQAFYGRIGYHEEPRLVLARWLDGRPPPD